MIKKLLDKKINPLFAVLVTFMLIFFIFADFDIGYIYAYLVLGVIWAASLFLSGVVRRGMKLADLLQKVTPMKACFLFLVVVAAVFSVLPNSNLTHLTLSLTISMLVFTAYFLFMEPGEKTVQRGLIAIQIVGALFAAYIIVVKLWPDFYWDYVYPHLSDLTKEMADRFMPQGYGVPLGGSTTYADYVISIALLANMARVFVGGGVRKSRQIPWLVITTVLYITAILLVNRRSEVLAIGAAGVVLIVLHLRSRGKEDQKARCKTIIPTVIVGVLVLSLFAYGGFLSRYTQVLEAVLPDVITQTGPDSSITDPDGLVPDSSISERPEKDDDDSISASELTSGRTALWKQAFVLFKQKPIFGIGWEQFMNHNTYEHEVHNTYLQWLCETGIIGFLLLMTPMMFLLFMTLKRTVRIRRGGQELPYAVKEMNFISLGLQVFFLALNLIDPAFYHLNFFCFFAFTIILEDASRRLEAPLSDGSECKCLFKNIWESAKLF